MSLALRYTLNLDDVTLDKDSYYSDPDGAGPLGLQCDPLLAGRYLCDAIGKRTTSSLGYSLIYDTRDNRIRSEEHTSALQSLMRISYAVFCLKIKKITYTSASNYPYHFAH